MTGNVNNGIPSLSLQTYRQIVHISFRKAEQERLFGLFGRTFVLQGRSRPIIFVIFIYAHRCSGTFKAPITLKSYPFW